MGDLTKNFSRAEFACKGKGCCNKADNLLDTRLVEALQTLRDKLGAPLTINSGYRCAKHNKAVGGASSSQHLSGAAADVAAPESFTPHRLASVAESLNLFDGIGLYDWGMHVDTRGYKARWDYRTKK